MPIPELGILDSKASLLVQQVKMLLAMIASHRAALVQALPKIPFPVEASGEAAEDC